MVSAAASRTILRIGMWLRGTATDVTLLTTTVLAHEDLSKAIQFAILQLIRL